MFIEEAGKFEVQAPRAPVPPSQSLPSSSTSYFDDEIFGPADTQSNDSVESEVQRYLREPLEPRSTDLLNYWKSREKLYPTLALMAKCFLAIPGTSVSSERAFSKAKNILGPQRNSLSPQSVEILLCLKDWYASFGPLYFDLETSNSVIIEESE